MKLDAGEARSRTSPLSSSGSPMRPSGTVVAHMRSVASSGFSVTPPPMRVPLKGPGQIAFTSTPCRWPPSPLSQSEPSTFSSRWPPSTAKPGPEAMPALAKTTSRPPSTVTTSSTRAWTCASSETSTTNERTVPPRLASAAVTFSSRSASTSARVTRAPHSARISAIARPSPLAAPVTTTRRPRTSNTRSCGLLPLMRVPRSSRAAHGRRAQYWNTGPEGRVPRAASSRGGGRLRRPGVVAGEGRASWDEDRASRNLAFTQAIEHVIHLLEWIRLGAQRHLAAPVQLEQLPEVDPAAHEVARDRGLGGDEPDRRERDGAAVPDDRVDPAPRQHLETRLVCLVGADEVEDDVGAAPASQLADRAGGVFLLAEHLVGAELTREPAPPLVGVDRNNRRGPQHADELKRDVADPADADHRRRAARLESWQKLLHGVVRGDAGVRVRRHVDRLDSRRQPEQRSLVDEHVLGEAAVARQPRELMPLAVHVETTPAGHAEAAAVRWVEQDGFADVG